MGFLYITLALVILLLMILIHELGHYIAGKALRFKINEFSIGLGPKLLQKKLKNGEVFSLRALPLGGYCAFMGEDEIVSGGADIVEKNNQAAKQEYFDSKGRKLLLLNDAPVYKRVIMLAAGAVFNLVSAVIFSIIFIAVVGYDVPVVRHTYLTTNSSVIQADDKIVEVNGKEISILNSFSELLSEVDKGENVVLTVIRNDAKVELTLKKQKFSTFAVSENSQTSDLLIKNDIILSVNGVAVGLSNPLNEVLKNQTTTTFTFKVVRANYEEMRLDYLDVSMSAAVYNDSFKDLISEITDVGIGIAPQYENQDESFLYAVGYSIPFTGKLSWAILGSFGKLFVDREMLKNLTGPVSTVIAIADITSQNILAVLILLPLIAANLGIFNLLPIPALDGSKILFCCIEAIRGKPLNRNVEAWIHFIGLMMLLGLIIVIELARLLS